MKFSQNFAFLFLFLEEVSNVRALPASNLDPTDAVHDLEGTVNKLLGAIAPGVGLKERDSPLEAVGDLIDAISPTVDDLMIHIPIDRRDASSVVDKEAENLAQLKELAKKFKKSVNLDAPVALDAFKKITTAGANAQDVAGHGIPSDLVGSLASKALSLIETAHGATKGAESLTEELPVVRKEKRATFNADAQRIDVTGSHAFVAPDFENGDVRGPCPGLNALANHGYLPHNGVATLVEYIVGCNTIFGMGIDISTVLAVYGTVESGNPLSLTPGFSMGGESSASQNLLGNLGGLLGNPRGLSGTHNQYEEDASGTRGDLYDPIGDNTNLNMSYFMDLYNMQIDAEEPNYSMDIMIAHNQRRFEQSEATNPYFFYGPSAGLVVRNAAYAFTGRLFVNTSEEYPEGIINKETLKSFFAVYGDEGKFTYKAGWERIPDIWYRRQSDYTLVSYGLDLVSWVTKFPRLLSIGGNTNGVNTFTGIDIANLTGGLFNAADLLEGNNLLCFGFEFIKEFTPNSLSSLFATITKPLEMVLDILDSTLLSLDCPAFKDLGVNGTDFTEYLKVTYPGVAKSGGAM